MKEEDIKLLHIDLSARLPYKVICKTPLGEGVMYNIGNNQVNFYFRGINPNSTKIYGGIDIKLGLIKPYLRPIYSMTKEEQNNFIKILSDISKEVKDDTIISTHKALDYLNSIHVDYRGLIPKGLAIEVTKNNNPYKD